MPPPTIHIVLPAYNEENALRELLPGLNAALKSNGLPYTICVVDDGSSDHTAALVETLKSSVPLQYLKHQRNRGYGAALKTGFIWVIQNAAPDDYVVSLDADNTHPPISIPDLLKKLADDCDVVTASYTCPGGRAVGVPWKRRILSRGVNTLFHLRFRYPGIRTYTNGFRAYRVAALQRAFSVYQDELIQERNFAGGTELFLKVMRQGARAAEVPFVLRYDRRGADSKIRILATIAGYLNLLAL